MTILPAASAGTRRGGELDFPPSFKVVAWHDPIVAAIGFPPHHPYVELLWLPVVGPSSTWLYRRLSHQALQHEGGTLVHLADLACAVGVGPATGATSTVQRSLRRLVRFGLASWHGHLAVRSSVPPLSQRHLQRLTPDLQAAHRALVAGRAADPVSDTPSGRASGAVDASTYQPARMDR